MNIVSKLMDHLKSFKYSPTENNVGNSDSAQDVSDGSNINHWDRDNSCDMQINLNQFFLAENILSYLNLDSSMWLLVIALMQILNEKWW